MRRAPWPSTVVAAAAAWLGTSAGAPVESTAAAMTGTGQVSGLVRLTTSVARPPRASAYTSRGVRPLQTPRASEIRNVVVYVKDAPAPAALDPVEAEMHQVGEMFTPGVLAVTRGSTVHFPNDDPFFHNVFSLSNASAFDLGRYRRGESRSVVMETPGLVKVYCDLHSYMSAVIVVLDHPHFAIPGQDGAFLIETVPAGRFAVAAWHERIGESTAAVVVEPGGRASVEFELPILDEE